MEEPATNQNTGLPLRQRLRRAAMIALILGLWGPAKIVWEQALSSEQDQMRYKGTVVTRQLRDQLGQGVTIGVLSGMRSVVADFIFVINVTLAWENQEWFRMAEYVHLVTTLQPRAPIFWDMGGWHLAYNASIGVFHDKKSQPDELRRLKASRYWTDRGIDVYKRGIENNPDDWKLMRDLAGVYQQRLKDYHSAAIYYKKASEATDAPVYLERFPSIMYDLAGDDQAAYASWKALWERLTPAQLQEKQHWREKIEENIRRLEKKLSVPKEKRIFPN